MHYSGCHRQSWLHHLRLNRSISLQHASLCICWEYHIAPWAKYLQNGKLKVDPKLNVWASGHFILKGPMPFWTEEIVQKSCEGCSAKSKRPQIPILRGGAFGHFILKGPRPFWTPPVGWVNLRKLSKILAKAVAQKAKGLRSQLWGLGPRDTSY